MDSRQIVVITGASGALGQVVAQEFAAKGATVVGLVHSKPLNVSSNHPHIYSFAVDLSKESEVESCFREIQTVHGGIDVLVNCAGGYFGGKTVDETQVEDLEKMLILNLKSAFLSSKHAAKIMKDQQSGRIINVASKAAFDTGKNSASYAISKSGVIKLTQAQAEELKAFNITVNAIVPSIFDTPANRESMPKADMSKWPQPEQLAKVIYFLASEDASVISGATIPVYGKS